jgi:hypothetical protein
VDLQFAVQSKVICVFEIFGLTYHRNLRIFDCEESPRICRFEICRFKNTFAMPTFANLPPFTTILAANLPLVSTNPQIFEKIKTVLMGYSRAWGKLIHEKT